MAQKSFKFYTIYKITNLVNGKEYVGKHATDSLTDGYFGSGQRVQHIIKKYGLVNLSREVLLFCKDRQQMNLAERILVVVDSEKTYNLRPGGGGGMMRPHTPEAKAKVSAANKGRKFTIEQRARMGDSHRGFRHTEESKQKMRSPKKGYKLSEAGKLKRIENNKTRIVSAETRAKMAAARRGFVFSKESIEKIAKANRGRVLSAESRLRMSLSGKRVWEQKRQFAAQYFPEGEK